MIGSAGAARVPGLWERCSVKKYLLPALLISHLGFRRPAWSGKRPPDSGLLCLCIARSRSPATTRPGACSGLRSRMGFWPAQLRIPGCSRCGGVSLAALAVALDGIRPPEQAAIAHVIRRRQSAVFNLAHDRARGAALLQRHLGLRQPPTRTAERGSFERVESGEDGVEDELAHG